MKTLLLGLLLFSFSAHGQKYLIDVESAMDADDYKLSYKILTSTDLVVRKPQLQKYHAMMAGTCYHLAIKKHRIDHDLWNTAMDHANSAILMGDSTVVGYALDIREDLITAMNTSLTNLAGEVLGPDKQSDIPYLTEYSDETIEKFVAHFSGRENLTPSQLHNFGILFYNEGVNIILNMDPELSIDEILLQHERLETLFQAAYSFMNVACEKNQDYCKYLEGIYFSLKNYSPDN